MTELNEDSRDGTTISGGSRCGVGAATRIDFGGGIPDSGGGDSVGGGQEMG